MNKIQLEEEINSTPTLPTIPEGVSHLLQALNHGDIHFTRLAKEIENFPSISVKIIAVSNSALFAPISPISSLLEACTRLGLNNVRSISFALSISSIFDASRCPEFDARIFWRMALLNAESASVCAEDTNDIDVQSARTTGLLYNLGLIWLAYYKPEETGSAITTSQSDENVSLSESLQNEMYSDHHVTGGMLAQAMGLPAQTINAITISHNNISDKFTAMDINMHHAHKLAENTILVTSLSDEEIAEYSDDKNLMKMISRLKNIDAIAESLFSLSN
ncbi:MAG: HDOD domain-containing protein [Gammaproteobacteria bacterium]|nr:HDOD domain-containing protein [Gammaproteobacteria bacterium]